MKEFVNQNFIKAVDYILSVHSMLNKGDIARELSISKSKFSEILNGRMNVQVENMIMLAEVYNISFDYLLKRKGPIEKNHVKDNYESKTPQIVTLSPQQEDIIVSVPIKAQAGYLAGFNDPEFIQTLPSYHLPNIQNGIFRMFQVQGHSMFPTIHDSAFVVGQFIENWVTDIKDSRIYVIITTTDGLVIKRALNRISKYGNLYCKSDNRKEYPSFTVKVEDIKEVWEVKMQLSYEFPDPTDLYDRINDIEADLLQLKNVLNTKDHKHLDLPQAAEDSEKYNKRR